MINQEVKGTLAKLLATENLTVEHRKVSTAAFDTKKRTLILPIWKTASSTLYDLLVGHEVGHALYTPDVTDHGCRPDILNIVEDARIERMMKRTYPGLRKSFYEGYRELWEKDFFGVKDEDLRTLNLADRINLYFKGKNDVEFSDDEKDFVTRCAKTTTFEECIDLANDIRDFMNQQPQEEELPDIPPSMSESGNAKDDQEIDIDNSAEGDDKEWPTETDPESDHRNDREFTKEDADLDTPSYQGGNEMPEDHSITDAALRESLDSLVDDDAKEWVYLNLPKVDLKEVVTPYNKIYDDLKAFFFHDDNTERCKSALEFTFSKCEEYKKSAQSSVNYLVKQFEMKKSADQYARASSSRTGVIDTNKLFSYKYNEDIFKKVTVVPDGKNHGLIMLLDWSGSMGNVLMDTLKQVLNLVWFCNKTNIPYRVYAFQSGYWQDPNDRDDISQKEGEVCISKDFHLLELFSSHMNARQLDMQIKMVWAQCWGITNYSSHGAYSVYTLGGTPLAEATICMREAVKQMRISEKVQKVNVVCLSDGESNPMSFVSTYDYGYREGELRSEYLCHNRNKVFVLRDPVTGYSRRFDHRPQYTTQEIVSFFREITDYNWIGIRLCSKVELNRALNLIFKEKDDSLDIYNKMWAKNRFVSLGKESGFTKMIYMPNQYIGSGTEDLEVKQKKEIATKAELTRAFKKHMGSKMTNKTILNAFIEQIA